MVVLKLPREINRFFIVFPVPAPPTLPGIWVLHTEVFAERLLEGSVYVYRWEEDMHIAYNCFN